MMFSNLFWRLACFSIGLGGFSTLSFAQNIPYVLLSPSQERQTTERTYSLLQYDSSRFLVMRANKGFSRVELEAYDAQMKHLNTYKTTAIDRRYIGGINLLGKMYLLYMHYRRNEIDDTFEGVSVYAKVINSEALLLEADSITLVEPFTMKSNFYRGDFAVSPDKSKILVYDYEEEGDIEGVTALTNKITLRVFDTSFGLLWKRSLNLAPEGTVKRIVSIKKLQLNNQGEVAILTDIFKNEEERSYSMKKITTNPTLFFVGKEPRNFMRFTPELGNLYFNQSNFTFDHQGNIVWVGSFSRRAYYQQAGMFYIKINDTRTKVLIKKIHEFSPQALQQALGSKKPKVGFELHSFKLQAFRLSSNTNEVTVSLEHQPFSNVGKRTHNVLVVRFTADGDIAWTNAVPKFGSAGDEQEVFLSHFLFLDQNNTYIVYNNEISAESQALITQIDSAGNKRDKVLFNYRLNNIDMLCPIICYTVGDGKLFVSLQSRFFKFYRFGLVDIRKMFE